MAKDNVVVKKIKPYPFAVQFAKDAHVFTGQVMKLVIHGFMVELGTVVVKVGDIYQVQFTLPTDEVVNMAQVKVIKTYDKYQASETSRAMRLAEFHFLNPSEDLKKRAKHFLKAIKQVGTDLV